MHSRYFPRQFSALTLVAVFAVLVTVAHGRPYDGASPAAKPASDIKGKVMTPIASMVSQFADEWEPWSLAFSPNSQELATSSPINDEVHIWQWAGRAHITKNLKTLRAGNPNGLLYSPNGKLLVGGHPVADGDKLLRVWNSGTGEIVRDISDPTGGSRFFGIAFSPDSHLLMRSQETGALAGDNFVVDRTDSWERVWGLRTSPFQPATFALEPSGRMVALGGLVRVAAEGSKPYLQPQIRIIDFEKREIDRSFDVLSANCELRFVTWSPDGTRIAVGGRPVFTGSRLTHATIQILDASKGIIGEYQSGTASHVQALTYTANGKYLIIAWDAVVEIWNGQRTEMFQSIPVAASAVAVSRDGHYMAVGGVDKNISVWKLE
jgi:WD40 repeat protein